MPYSGEVASLLTALCYSGTAVLFARAGRRVGSATVNVIRLGMALLVMFILHLTLVGTWFPAGTGPVRLAWLGASGLIGFALGDALLFESYVLMGPRLAVIVYTVWPVFAALLAWAFLGQAMGPAKACAMLVTLGGIAMVVADKGGAPGQAGPRRPTLGLVLCLGGALGQAVGFIFSKVGMAGGFSPISANLIRVGAGASALWAWQVLRGTLVSNLKKLKDRRAAMLTGLGALFGPVLAVSLSLYAINHARYLGVASTLMSLSPVLILPFSAFVEKERVGFLAVAGTLVALGGATALFLV